MMCVGESGGWGRGFRTKDLQLSLALKASFTIMRRTFECGAKARLSFPGGPHVPVNMADSMENASRSTVSGSGEAMGVPKNFKDLQKLGVGNITQYSAANVPYPVFFPHRHSLLMFAGVWPPEKLIVTLVPPGASCNPAHDCETCLL